MVAVDGALHSDTAANAKSGSLAGSDAFAAAQPSPLPSLELSEDEETMEKKDLEPPKPPEVEFVTPKTKVDKIREKIREIVSGDFSSICLLLFLYVLQGIPLGLMGAVPLLLQRKNATYSDQAVFSFAFYPFSFKLLWAPIVDSVYWKRIGRRKSWMVPSQYLIGIVMLVLSYRVPYVLGKETSHPDVLFLMFMFLPLNFLAATQDVAVDGWALTMLSKKNLGHASTCNAVGQATGAFIGYTVFLALESADFANTFFRSAANQKDEGLVDLSSFVFFWGCVFMITTTLVLIFKREVDNSKIKNEHGELCHEPGILETYLCVLRLIKMKPMIVMIVFLITQKVTFSASDSMTDLKLVGMGVPQDRIAFMDLFITFVQLLLPWVIGKYSTGPRPLNIFLLAYPYRILMCGMYAGLLYYTPTFQLPDSKYPLLLYAIWTIAKVFRELGAYSIFVSLMAFNAQISDPIIGGTYMTLLNTITNLGSMWPSTAVLALTDKLTWKDCLNVGNHTLLYDCHTKTLAEQCTASGAVCETRIDGYYLAVAICSLYGVIWYLIMFGRIRFFQTIPRKDWQLKRKS